MRPSPAAYTPACFRASGPMIGSTNLFPWDALTMEDEPANEEPQAMATEYPRSSREWE